MKSARVVSLLVVIVCLYARAFSQTNPNTDIGLKPYDSFHGGNLDSVSLSSGNLFFHKTEYGVAQRGGVGLTFSLQYNNKNFNLHIECINGSKGPWQMAPGSSNNPNGGGEGCQAYYTWLWIGGGVNLIFDQSLVVGGSGVRGPNSPISVDSGYQDQYGDEVFVNVYSAWTSDGSSHQLADTGNGYRSIDGSGILWNGVLQSGNVQDRTGMYSGGSADTNGNYLSIDSSNNPYADTLGRVIPALPNVPVLTAPPPSTASLSSCPNLNLPYQPVIAAYSWNPPGPTGSSPYILCYASVYVRTALFGTGAYMNGTYLKDLSRSVNLLQSVVRPDGTAWTFTYDGANPNDTTSIGYGDLLKIVFPMGGSLSYTYATVATYQGQYVSPIPTTTSRTVVTRTVNANDGTGPHAWTYNWVSNIVTNTNSAYVAENTVTDPLGNDTVHQFTGFFGGPSLYETQTRYYQGSQGSGTLLKTVNTDYTFSSNPFDLGVIGPAPTAINVHPIRVTTVWPNGLTSKEEKDYDSAFTFRDPVWGSLAFNTNKTTATYAGSLGTISARREFDYGSGAPGGLLRQTATTYLWQGNNNYLNSNLLDLPGSVQVLDGSGNQVALTNYGYDEYSLATSGAPQHNTPPNGSFRGNQTSVHHWLSGSTTSTTNCPISVSNGYLVSYAHYNDTGTVASSTDTCATSPTDANHTTTHTYSGTYDGAYPTQTCNPKNQCVGGAYDFNSGLITSFTDANGQTSNYSYDNLWRMTQAVFPADSSGAHPETDFDFPNPTTVHRKRKQTSTPTWIEDYAFFDGLGRTTQTRLVDPEGDDFVDTAYDALGRVSTVSNPHRSGQSQTDGTTTTYYDALSRVVQVAPQDGTLVPSGTSVTQCQANNTCTDFSNFPTVTVTDEAGKQRRSRTDALGRLVEVDEPGGGVNGPGTPGSGTITISGSLYSSTTSGTKATGSFSVSGNDQFVLQCGPGGQCDPKNETKVWDSGQVSVTINGVVAAAGYGQNSTQAGLASSIASQLNPHPVTYSDSGTGTITLTADTPGPNYSLSASVQSNDPTDFGAGSFSVSLSGATLTGGVYPVTTYDSGTVTVTVDGFTASAAYSQSENSTASAVASALAAAFNVSGSPVTASVSGTSITLTAKAAGTASDYSVSGSSTTSFTASSTTLSGGTNPGGDLYAFCDLVQLRHAGQSHQSQPGRRRLAGSACAHVYLRLPIAAADGN